jgi:predicted RNase H-like HicB family nuclease
MESDMRHYPMQVFWSDEDEAFIAVVNDLPGCSAADTEADAIAQAHIAIELWIEAASKAGNPIPEPSKPEIPWAVGF